MFTNKLKSFNFRSMKTLKRIFNVLSASFYLISGGIILIFNRNNFKPIYRGVRHFMDHESYQITLQKLKADPQTNALIEARYNQYRPLDWDALKLMPENTLGFQYAKFMNDIAITPIQDLPENGVQISPEVDYIRQRVRLIHDIHHVLCGFPATELGEMAISAFYVAQINSPLNSMLMAFGLIKCTIKMPARLPELMHAISYGWNSGLKSQNLFGIKFEEMWHLSVDEIRKQLKIEVTQI